GVLTLLSVKESAGAREYATQRQAICAKVAHECVVHTHICAYNTQMKSRPLTVKDLCCVSEYSRHQMRGLLAALPAFAARASQVKVAAEFSAHDLLVVALCCRLESHYGLKRARVATLAKGLAQSLSGPRPLAREARLILNFSP